MQEIKKYEVTYFAGGAHAGGYAYRAIITLWNDDGLTGVAFFLRKGARMPASDKQSGPIYCRYPWDEYPRILDLLRNEKPVYLDYQVGYKMGYISTSREPIGEGEPV